ncbi:lysylphosphatidylglycerol synthase transmembrane domain-containing protein [Limihaloglobus sulfuriphilus]|nr:lysylphosphatidylglycerol synthase transmembrane domain-containing protein [Limihaloglobus sulfuriphilus]
MNKKIKAQVLTILRFAVGIAVIAALLLMTDFERVAELTSQLSLTVILLSLLLYLVQGLFLAARWQVLLRAQDIIIPTSKVFAIEYLGLFYNNILFSSLGGDLLRAWYVTEYSEKKVESVFSIVVDRLAGVAVLIFFCIGGMLLVNREVFELGYSNEKITVSGLQEALSGRTAVFIALALAAALAAAAFFSRGHIKSGLSLIKEYFHRIAAAVKIYANKRAYLCGALFFSAAAQITCITGVYIVGKALGVEAPVKYYYVILPLSWFASSVPVSPGGIGLMEGSVTAMFAALPEVSIEQGLMIAFAQRALLIAGTLPGIFIHIGGFHLPRRA